jgi:hypothetical protein
VIKLSQQENKVIFNHLNKFLKHFEANELEEKFWEETYKLKSLKIIRDKFKLILDKDA